MAKMQWELPNGYPQELTDDELADAITWFHKWLADKEWNLNLNYVMQRYPLLQLGENELQTRNIRRFEQASKRLSTASLAVAAAAIVLAGLSLWSAQQSTRTQQRQLEALESIVTIVRLQQLDTARSPLEDIGIGLSLGQR